MKRDDESFNDLLDRLSRQEKDVEEMAGFLIRTVVDYFRQRSTSGSALTGKLLQRSVSVNSTTATSKRK